MQTTEIKTIDNNRFAVQGDLDFETVLLIQNKGKELIDQASEHFYIDLRFVSNATSAGVALLLDWMRYAKSLSKEITYINTPPKLSEIAHVSGFVIGVGGISTLEHA